MFNNICRAKRLDNGDWAEGYYVYDGMPLIVKDLQTVVSNKVEFVNVFFVRDNTICRAVGRNDKNGTPIFEGDIVKGYGVISYIVRHGEFNGTVGLGYYYGIGFHLERIGHPEHKVPLSSISCDNGEFEVLGNVYDNPELLVVED